MEDKYINLFFFELFFIIIVSLFAYLGILTFPFNDYYNLIFEKYDLL